MVDPTTTDGERSTEAAIDSAAHTTPATRTVRWGAYLLALSGLGFVANGLAMLYRVLFAPGFEAGVETLDGATRGELAATNHEVVHYVDHLHVNVAGLMVAVGIAVIALAWFGVRRGQRWAWATTIALPVVFLAHSLPVHQTAGFAFDELTHLGPGLLWLPALIVGAAVAGHGLRAVDRSPERGDRTRPRTD